MNRAKGPSSVRKNAQKKATPVMSLSGIFFQGLCVNAFHKGKFLRAKTIPHFGGGGG